MCVWNLRYGLLFLGCLAAAANVEATAYYSYDRSGDGNWHDANKAGIKDCNLCWAAAASNILDWGGWGTNTATTEVEIFSNFKDNWVNVVGDVGTGWEWWFDGLKSKTDQEKTDLGLLSTYQGDHWPSLSFNSFFRLNFDRITGWDYSNALSNIDTYLHEGMGTTIGIVKDDPNDLTKSVLHYLTVWGYEYDATSQAGNSKYKGIYYTDSDDNVNFKGIAYSDVKWDSGNSRWNMDEADPSTVDKGAESYADGWYIREVQALDVQQISLLSGTSWLSNKEPIGVENDWTNVLYDDTEWTAATAPYPNLNQEVTPPKSVTTPQDIVSNTKAKLMWIGDSKDGTGTPDQAYFRRHFSLNGDQKPFAACAKVIADDVLDVWINGFNLVDEGTLVGHMDPTTGQPDPIVIGDCYRESDFSKYLVDGDNVIAIRANDGGPGDVSDYYYQYVFFDGYIQPLKTISEPSIVVLFGGAFIGLLIFLKRKRRLLRKYVRTAKSAATMMHVSCE